MSRAGTDNVAAWEQAEIQRSASEAARRAAAIHATAPKVARRYANPPAETPFPLEYAYHLVGDIAGASVLDIGCGTGENTTLLAARAPRVVYALDISHQLLQLARRRVDLDRHASRVRTLCASSHAIPLPDGSVDLVFGSAILHHLDLRQTAAEVRRVLRVGGRAIFIEPIRNSPALAFLRRLVPVQHPDVSPFERPLRFDEIDMFAASFAHRRQRLFRLPSTALLMHLGASSGLQRRAIEWDRRVLQRFPRAARFATVIVFMVRR